MKDSWILGIAAFGVALVGTGVMRAYAQSAGVIDIPNHRSSHGVPTPRGGGVAIVSSVVICVLLLVDWESTPSGILLAVLLCGGLVALVGFIDDHRSIPASYRLAVQFLAASVAIGLIGELPAITFGSAEWHPGIAGKVMSVLFVVWFLNLFNFMDGIDGIAGSQAAFVAVASLLLAEPVIGTVSQKVFVIVAASSVGFLLWNWAPAKIFMGDAGSSFLGMILALLVLTASIEGLLSVWTSLILNGLFIVDATYTLIRRKLRGTHWAEAHRCHAYQIIARQWRSHSRTTALAIAVNVCWLLPIAAAAQRRSEDAWWLFLAAYLPLTIAVGLLGAGTEET